MATEDLTFRFNVTGNAVPQLKRVQQQVSAVDRQIKRGNASLKAHSGQYNSTAVAANKFAKGALQQAGFQVGDFVVQVTNGTSAMQAFGQQGAQLAGVFGPIGAVVGAGIAIFSALAIVFEKSQSASKSFEDTIADLSSALDEYQSAARNANQSSEDLSQKYGEAAKSAKALFEAQSNLRRLDAIDILGKTVVALRDEFGSFADVSRQEIQKAEDAFIRLGDAIRTAPASLSDADLRLAINSVNLFDRKIVDLKETMRSTDEQAFALAKELADLGAAEGPAQIAQELEDVRATFIGIVGSISSATEEQRELYRQLIESAIAAMDLNTNVGETATELEEIVVAARPLNEILSAAAQSALLLSQRLAAAPGFLQNMKNRAAVMQSEIIAISSGLGQAAASAAAFRKERELYYDLENIAHYEQRKVAEQRINDEVRQFEANQKLTASLGDLQKQFVTTGSSGGAAMTKIKEKTQELSLAIQPLQEKMKSVSNTIESSMEGAFMSVVDGTKTVGEAFRSMAVEIIKELYRVFVVKQITGFITNAIGGYFNLNQVSGPAMPLGTGNVRPVARPSSFAGGGYTGNGSRAGGLDGKGGFMAMMHPRESVIDHTRGQGAGGVIVNQTINVSTGVSQTVRSEIRSLMPQIAENAKNAVVDAKRRGGSYGRAFA